MGRMTPARNSDTTNKDPGNGILSQSSSDESSGWFVLEAVHGETFTLFGFDSDNVHRGSNPQTTIHKPQCSAPATIEAPTEEPIDLGRGDEGWLVVVYNNDYNTYQEVMTVLIVATHCTAEEAYIEAWEIDHLGKSVVHNACEDECLEVAGIVAQIGIRVEVVEG